MPRADMDEIERLLWEADGLAYQGNGYAVRIKLIEAVRKIYKVAKAARPAPAGAAGEDWRGAWNRWASERGIFPPDGTCSATQNARACFRAGWDAARAADAARGERT